MNEWGFICQDNVVGIGKSATINNFKSRRGYVRDERLVLSNPRSSYLGVSGNYSKYLHRMNKLRWKKI